MYANHFDLSDVCDIALVAANSALQSVPKRAKVEAQKYTAQQRFEIADYVLNGIHKVSEAATMSSIGFCTIKSHIHSLMPSKSSCISEWLGYLPH